MTSFDPFNAPIRRACVWLQRRLLASLLLASAVAAPAPSFAEDDEIQTTDSGISGEFEVSASFVVVSRGEVLAAAEADDGHLYLGDEGVLTVKFHGAKLFGDRASIRCRRRDMQPDGVINETDCTPEQVPFGTVGTQGEYRTEFIALATDPAGLWRTEVEFMDGRTGDAVVVEVSFQVHTGLES
jgi:hypothetical protein